MAAIRHHKYEHMKDVLSPESWNEAPQIRQTSHRHCALYKFTYLNIKTHLCPQSHKRDTWFDTRHIQFSSVFLVMDYYLILVFISLWLFSFSFSFFSAVRSSAHPESMYFKLLILSRLCKLWKMLLRKLSQTVACVSVQQKEQTIDD